MDEGIRRVLRQEHGLVLKRRLGRGGFAEVWEAESAGGVACAVKISLDPIDEQCETVRKELENLQLVQQISGHPHILTLIDYWVIEGHLITRWELSTEGTLLDKLFEYQRQGHAGIPPKVLLTWMHQAADGIDFLNAKGIYHRDIKPQNLLLFHGQVKLADLGMVKFAGLSTASHTGTGTLGYLPPEAYQGHRLSPSVDLYSLAATYVKLRTGREPFGQSAVECVQRQLRGEPVLSGLPEAEAALLRQALAPSPEKRPQGCRKLMVELAKALQQKNCVAPGKPPAAQEKPSPQRGPRSVAVRTASGNSAPQDNAQENLVARTPVVQLGHMEKVTSVAFSPDNLRLVSGSEDGTAILWDVSSGEELFVLRHEDVVNAVAFSPDGKWVLTGSSDGSAVLWEVRSGKKLGTLEEHKRPVTSVAFSPDGKFALTGSYDDTAILWDLRTRETLFTFQGHKDSVRAVAFSPSGKFVLTGSDDGTVILWDLGSKAAVRKFEVGEDEFLTFVTSVVFSPDERYVLVAVQNEVATMWDARTGEEVQSFGDADDWINSVAFSPDGRYVLTGSDNCELLLWDANTGELVREFEEHDHGVSAVAFSPNGLYVASGSGTTVALWNAHSGSCRRVFRAHKCSVRFVSCSPDGQYVLALTEDETAYLWEVHSGTRKAKISCDQEPACPPLFSPDGRFVLTYDDEEAVLWERDSGEKACTFRARRDGITSVAFSPQGNHVLTGSEDGTAILWEVETELPKCIFRGHLSEITSVAFSPDGRKVFTASEDGSVRIWDVQTGKELFQWWHLKGGRWLTLTPQGFFTGSSRAVRFLRHRDPETGEWIPREQSLRYHRPDKVAEAFQSAFSLAPQKSSQVPNFQT